MSNVIHVAAAALNQTPIDWANNCANISAAIDAARTQGVQLLCLPELCLTGYGCEDIFLSEWIYDSSIEYLGKILPMSKGIAVSIGLPIKIDQLRYNGVALLVDGEIKGISLKQNLDNVGVYYEPRWFTPWVRGTNTTIKILGSDVPVGDLIYELGSTLVAFEICQDAWVEDRLAKHFADQHVDIILNPSASYFTFGKHSTRTQLCNEGSKFARAGYVYSSLLGCESGRLIFDGDSIIAAAGKTIACSKRFSFEHFTLISTLLPIPAKNSSRSISKMPSLVVKAPVVSVSISNSKGSGDQSAPWESSATLKEEEFSRAAALGLFDYLRKSHSQGFILSLSGGVDSCATASLVKLMIDMGVAELGDKRFVAALPSIESLKGLKPLSPATITHELLTCAYQETRNNSAAAKVSAEKLAKAINAKFYQLKIDPLVDSYIRTIEEAIGRPLSWKSDDIALQNIQARTRSPSIWLLANIERKLLLATSNRTEASLGYSTMDGDTSGGLSPLADIDKQFLRAWLVWLEYSGPLSIGAMPDLHGANELTPGPELRPLEAKQSGESDLMPFAISSALQQLALAERMCPKDALLALEKSFANKFDRQQLCLWLCQFYRLWSINQWKRERLPPSFHLDEFNIDPKTWCRFPILSGSFEQELIELQLLSKSR